MMKRPLVWVGIAYAAGEVWAGTKLPLWAGLLTAGIWIILLIITGRYKHQKKINWMLYILPVFYLSGFVNFCRASGYPAIDSRFDEQAEVTFYGKISDWEEKENSIACVLSDAKIAAAPAEGETAAALNGIAGQADGLRQDEYEASLLLYMDKGADDLPGLGDMVCGRGRIEKLKRASNPGQFDARSYYHARGIDYMLWPEEINMTGHSDSLIRRLGEFRQRWLAVYRDCLHQKDAGILWAMLLGNRVMLDDDLKSLYQKMGIMHILAISGVCFLCWVFLIGERMA